jgi:3-(3-hydroxy-phenyl)propionate hydroxylase
MNSYDVIIAGFGPTGATLAALLGRHGHRVLAIERDAEVYQLPRAVHFDAEVMRIFQTLGVVDELLPHLRAISCCEFWTADREVLVHVPTDEPTDQGWRSDYLFHQPSLEKVLREKATGEPSVELRLCTEVLDFREDGETLEVDIRGHGHEVERVRARWLVGCDGANSLVRRKTGLELEDLIFDEPWVVVDIRGAKELRDAVIQFCDPARPTTIVAGAHDMQRFEFMLRPGEKGEEMVRPEQLRELMAPWVDPDTIEIVRAAEYRFHALVAKDWLRGRVLLAGDAAHQTPPFLGQGMCAGIRDALNLSWKLDRVLRCGADPALLASYGSERAPHVRTFLEAAIAAGRIICTQDPELARQRDKAMLEARERGEPPPALNSLPPLGEGLLQTPEADRHPLVGTLAPQPRLTLDGAEQLLDDVTGPGFRLVLRGPAPDASARRALERLEGHAVTWPDGGFFDEHGIHAFLIRPDHAVFGVARTPEQVGALLEDALARLA